MYADKPILGLAGGIAAGKSFVAAKLAELGCCVISSDALVRTAYTHPAVKRAIFEMFGDGVFDPGGDVDRAAVGRAVFADAEQRRRLEQLLHPIVNEVRLQRMRQGAADPAVRAFVWDSPLLFETGLDALCDAVLFVETPPEVRAQRAVARGWSEKEWRRRENVQHPLDKKREKADYVIRNAADAPADARGFESRLPATTPPAASVGVCDTNQSQPRGPRAPEDRASSTEPPAATFPGDLDEQLRRVMREVTDPAHQARFHAAAPATPCGSGCGCHADPLATATASTPPAGCCGGNRGSSCGSSCGSVDGGGPPHPVAGSSADGTADGAAD